MSSKDYIYGDEKECPVCGKLFRAKDKDRKTYSSKYCSYACNNKSRRLYCDRECCQCGAVFTPIRKKHSFCSRQCAGLYKKQHHRQTKETTRRKRVASFCCGCISRCLRGKTDTTQKLIGYTYDELTTHLESLFKDGMTWDNYGKGGDQWSIDHVRPISTFPKSATQKEINALENLQPMWHRENCAKSNKWENQ